MLYHFWYNTSFNNIFITNLVHRHSKEIQFVSASERSERAPEKLVYLHVLGSTFLISTLLPYFNNVITDSIQPHYIHCLFIWASECCVSYEVIFTMATTAITNKSSVLYHLLHYTHFNNILITNLVHRHFRHFLFICASERSERAPENLCNYVSWEALFQVWFLQ